MKKTPYGVTYELSDYRPFGSEEEETAFAKWYQGAGAGGGFFDRQGAFLAGMRAVVDGSPPEWEQEFEQWKVVFGENGFVRKGAFLAGHRFAKRHVDGLIKSAARAEELIDVDELERYAEEQRRKK